MDKNQDERLRALVLELKKGNILAFDKLYYKYKDKVYHFVLGLIKSKPDAEGIIQDVFIKLWETKEGLNPDRSFDSYLFTITYRLAIDHFRQKSKSLAYLNKIRKNYTIASNKTEKDVDFNELNTALDSVIEKLPPQRKEVFLLSRKQGLTNEEISLRMGISKNTVENQLVSALKFIRKQMSHFSSFILFF